MYVNRITLTGNAGHDAKEGKTKNGTRVVSFSIAHTEGKGDQQKTTWFDVAVFATGNREWLCDQAAGVRKGSRVVVDGKFQARPYTKKDGTPSVALEILANSVGILVKEEKAPAQTYEPEPPSEDNIPF